MLRKKVVVSLAVCCSLAITVFVLFAVFKQTILLDIGRFMVPYSDLRQTTADVAILEGTDIVYKNMISRGIELLQTGKVKRIVVVLHSIAPSHRPFAFPENYPSGVEHGLRDIGLTDHQFKVIVTHINNPITLIAAKGALEELSKDNISSAFLISSGFHMRRSLLIYQHLGARANIRVYPVPCFGEYTLQSWWNQDGAVRDFFFEFLKLTYYTFRGYIPVRLYSY